MARSFPEPSKGRRAPEATKSTGRAFPAPRAGKTAAAPGHAASVDNSPLGILKQVGSVVGGVAKGLGSLGQEVGEAIYPTTGPLSGKKGKLSERFPVLTETLVRSPIKTAKSLNPQDLLVDIPTGHFAETALGKRVAEEGALGAGLSTIADLSVLAGGAGAVGKAAGAGRLAQAARLEEIASASAKAAGLSRKATLSTIEEAARAAEAAGDARRAAGLGQAAGQIREAQALRAAGPATRAERATAFAETAKSLGSHVAAAPAKPYELAARGAGKLAGKAIEKSPAAAAVAERVGAAVERLNTNKRFRDLHHEEVTAKEAEALYSLIDGRHQLGDSMKHLSLDEQAAVTLRRSGVGADPAFRKLYDSLDEDGQRSLIEAAIPGADAVEAFRIATDWDEGRLAPEKAAQMDTAAARLDTFYKERERDVFLTGKGTSKPLSERGLEARRQRAEGRPADMDVGLRAEELQGGTRRRLSRIEDEAASLHGEPTPAPLTRNQERRLGADAERIRRIEDEARRNVPGADTRLSQARGEVADRAARIEEGQRTSAVKAQEKRLATLATQRDKSLAKLDELHKRAQEDIRSAPPQDRPALRANEVAARFAKGLAGAHPEQAHFFLELADELAVTTKALRDKGIVPEFSFGGKQLEGKSPVTSAGPALRAKKKLSNERVRTEGRLRLSVASQVEAAAQETRGVLRNEFAGKTQAAFGDTASKVIDAKRLSGEELASALDESGYRAWDPRTGKELAPEDVRPDSAVLPRTLFDNFTKYVAAADKNSVGYKVGRVYDKATGAWKTTVLALSPRWQMGNMIGNTSLAVVGAGVNPASLPRLWGEAADLLRKGEAPVAIRARGFHAGDLAEMGREPTGKLRLPRIKGRSPVEWSYRMNSYVDDVNRTAIYLAEKGKGLSDEAAVKSALRAAGDFSRMSRTERTVIRRAVPFWAWQKHITTLAFRLPLENPARVAWTLHLADAADRAIDDPGGDNPFNEGSLPAGEGQRLSLRSLDPFGSSIALGGLTDLDSINRRVGYSLNPLLKVGGAAVTGLSANRGGQPVRTPESEFGAQAEPLFGVRHPVRLAQLAAQSVPQVKQLQDFAAGTAVPRVETGQPIEGRTTDRGRLAQLARLLGVPFPEPEQVTTKSFKRKKRG